MRDRILSIARKKAAERAQLPQAQGYKVAIVNGRVRYVRKETNHRLKENQIVQQIVNKNVARK